ncbi:MAG: hypothetical protein V3S69_05365 [Dehalococcoidales bacterium]
MDNIYGYVYYKSFIETGRTERGAKIAASRAGCNEVGYRSYINNMYIPTSRKVAGKWEVYHG